MHENYSAAVTYITSQIVNKTKENAKPVLRES